MELTDKFKFTIPAELSKAEDGNWRIRGLASTEDVDQQNDILLQKGIDLSPIDAKRGIINWEHQKGPENIIGLLDGYARQDNSLFIEGRLFKNHSKAKAVKEIMESLGDGDRGRVGLSVEGGIVDRDPKDPRKVRKCIVTGVAVTMNPVNQKTYADLVKSMNASDQIEFQADDDLPTFTADQIVDILKKALGLSAGSGEGYQGAPADRSGGDALATESMDSDDDEEEKPKPKQLKKMTKEMYKANINLVLDRLQTLYPEYSRSEIWGALADRLTQTFPDINESYPN